MALEWFEALAIGGATLAIEHAPKIGKGIVFLFTGFKAIKEWREKKAKAKEAAIKEKVLRVLLVTKGGEPLREVEEGLRPKVGDLNAGLNAIAMHYAREGFTVHTCLWFRQKQYLVAMKGEIDEIRIPSDYVDPKKTTSEKKKSRWRT